MHSHPHTQLYFSVKLNTMLRWQRKFLGMDQQSGSLDLWFLVVWPNFQMHLLQLLYCHRCLCTVILATSLITESLYVVYIVFWYVRQWCLYWQLILILVQGFNITFILYSNCTALHNCLSSASLGSQNYTYM